jgi:hypothetical protein
LEPLLISALQPLLGSALRALLSSSMGEKMKAPMSRLKKEIGGLRHRIPFAGPAAKIAVVLVFTVCWLLIALVRSRAGSDSATTEGSSLLGLATALQQGAISGRDFQSMYGPAAQLLAWIATAATVTRSAIDAYGMITFFFCAASALLAAAMLLICDRISWQECAIFYAFSLFLNLFFHVFDIRTVLLLLNAVVAYRIVAAETLPRQIVWATGSGLLCFVAQLVTVELGICAAIAVVCALAVGSVLTRRAMVLLAVEVFVATLVVANLGMAIVFKLTSSSYKLLFDYHNYSLEILHGYHNSMGMLWGLSPERTLVLAIVALYVIGVCAAAAWRTDPLDASLLASLAFAAVVWFKTALIRSDLSQIVLAFTPVIVILTLLARMEWTSPARRGAWAAAACGALFVWPSLSLSAPADLGKVIRGETNPRAAIRDIYKTARPLDTSLRATLVTADLADRQDVPVLAFPYDNYTSVGLRRPFFAPVLESYAASTESLERYYVRALESRRRAGLEIVYGIDGGPVSPVDGLQAITRTPVIFEYLYKNFELASNAEHADARYILHPRPQPRNTDIEQLKFSIPQQSQDSGILKLDAPSACGLVLLEVQIDYAKNPHVFRPSGIELSLSNSDQFVWRGSIMPLVPNESFVTYISPLPSERFHKVFGQDPVQGVKWDKIEYHASSADMLGSRANFIRIGGIQCVDPKKFVEPVVSERNSSLTTIVPAPPTDIDGLDREPSLF